MARRSVGKANPRTAGGRPRDRHGKTEAAASEGSLKEQLRALERERDALRAAVEREQKRVRKLEEANASARDRVAWALDSLQNILDSRR
jgi:predicted RNase H-like nuclease (RuvC/YqgF family)